VHCLSVTVVSGCNETIYCAVIVASIVASIVTVATIAVGIALVLGYAVCMGWQRLDLSQDAFALRCRGASCCTLERLPRSIKPSGRAQLLSLRQTRLCHLVDALGGALKETVYVVT
jgi:hypothetical protein